MSMTIEQLITLCGERAYAAGWYKDYEDMRATIMASDADEASIQKQLTFWDKVWNGNRHALIMSEVAESFEGLRKGKKDEHLLEFSSVAIELADVIIRVMDYSYANNIDLNAAIMAKLEYNSVRPDHKLENRTQAGGKAF